MPKKIINLEINEVSPNLINDYIRKNKSCNLAKLLRKKNLQIFTTKALDISKERLYPSQTWASFNTGKPYSEHKCYWYSDYLNYDELIWNKLVSKNKSVGILGSLHSSKLPKDLLTNKNYKFYLPDCFSNQDLTKPERYKNFQSLNNTLVGKSARVTGVKNLINTLSRNLLRMIIFPKKFGISILSIKMILSIIYFSFRYRNKEMLRMAQFPLLASIFAELYSKYQPSYSTLFSNHVAGNMHRYWYAYDRSSFFNKNKYPEKWIRKNKRLIFLSLDLMDSFIGHILTKKAFKDCIILITSSMGQEANSKFDKKYLAKYDGKIIDINLFLQKFYTFFFEKYGFKVELNCNRNMAPQYGFSIKNKETKEMKVVVRSISDFVASLGFENKVDEESGSIVLTLSPSEDIKLQNKYKLNELNSKYAKYGFEFFPIEDHHSGKHCEYGSLITINASQKFKQNLCKYVEKKKYLNYLNFYKLITDYLTND